MRIDGEVLDTNLEHKTEIRCKIMVLGLLGLDWGEWGGECVEIPGLSLMNLTVSFVDTFIELLHRILIFSLVWVSFWNCRLNMESTSCVFSQKLALIFQKSCKYKRAL